MDYRNIFLRELKQFSDTHKDYNLGSVIYSFLRLGDGGLIKTVKNITEITDEEMYKLLCKAKVEESEEAV